MKKQPGIFIFLLLISVLMLSACSKQEMPAASTAHGIDGATAPITMSVRLGIFKNITHAAGYVALEQGLFQKAWGDHVKIEVVAFDNGSDFSTALATDQIDLGYVGPGPAANLFVKSKNYRVISGSATGGAVLIAATDSLITEPKDLLGKTVAVPSKGNTNDLLLRLLLAQNKLKVSTDQTGVNIISRAPAETMMAMRQKEIEAALIPEPWGTQMVQEGIGKIIVEWDQIPPNNGGYPSTLLTVSDKFLNNHREMVKQAVRANAEAIDFINKHPEAAYELINNRLKVLSGKGMDLQLLQASLKRITFTTDITKEAIEDIAKVSIDAGYIKNIKKEELDLSKFLDLGLLTEVKQSK